MPSQEKIVNTRVTLPLFAEGSGTTTLFMKKTVRPLVRRFFVGEIGAFCFPEKIQ